MLRQLILIWTRLGGDPTSARWRVLGVQISITTTELIPVSPGWENVLGMLLIEASFQLRVVAASVRGHTFCLRSILREIEPWSGDSDRGERSRPSKCFQRRKRRARNCHRDASMAP